MVKCLKDFTLLLLPKEEEQHGCTFGTGSFDVLGSSLLSLQWIARSFIVNLSI